MTDVLILGGTGWLSGRIARRWVDAGAAVTCVARGGRATAAGARLVVADRTGPDAYADLADHHWDEVVDISSDPAAVEAAVSALGDRAAHWTYVSSLSVYAHSDVIGADETAPLAEPMEPGDDYDYSRAKSAAERSVRTLGDDRVAIVRSGLIAGPGDPSDRFGYWPARFALAGDGPVLVPAAEQLASQVIDVDDVAEFIVDAGARGWAGTVNAIAPTRPLAETLAVIREVAGHTGDLVEATPGRLLARDVTYWAGPRSLPLWLPPDMPGFAAHDGSAYQAAGGRIRPLEETAARVLADERERGLDRERAAGLTRAEELEIIAEL